MAIIGSIIIRMGADARPLLTGFDSALNRMTRFATSASSLFLGGLFAGAGVAGIGDAVSAASDLNETLSKTSVIFGDAAGVIISQADRMSAAFGTNKNEYINAAANFGAVFKGLGRSQEDAAAMGNQLTQLGLDMASFDNVANTEVFTALGSAMRGEFDPLERFRVFLTADVVAAKALEMGLASSKKEIDDSAKKTATLALIMEQTADAQGDLARTAESPANQFRRLNGQIQNMSISVGQLLIPAVSLGTQVLSDFAASAQSSFDSNRGMVEGLGPMMINMSNIFGGSLVNIGIQVQDLFTNLGLFGDWFASNWVNVFIDGATAAFAAIKNSVTNMGIVLSELPGMIMSGDFSGLAGKLTPTLEGFKRTTSELPKWVASELATLEGIEEVRADMAAARAGGPIAEAARAAVSGPVAAASKPGAAATLDLGMAMNVLGAIPGVTPDLALGRSAASDLMKGGEGAGTAGFSAIELNSKEAATAFARARNAGGDTGKPIDEVSKNTKAQIGQQMRTNSLLEKVNSALSSGTSAMGSLPIG